MSAETLRRAATLMRERAESAQDYIDRGCEPYTAEGLRQDGLTEADAEHFASWHPTVALAVADWLDSMAARAEMKIEKGGNEAAVWSHERHALTVARAYLFGEAVS